MSTSPTYLHNVSKIGSKSVSVRENRSRSLVSTRFSTSLHEKLQKEKSPSPKREIITNVEYLSPNPTNGYIQLIIVRKHVYLLFQSNPDSPRQVVLNKNKTTTIKFCLEDTPTYQIEIKFGEKIIKFQPGRELGFELFPFAFKKDSFANLLDKLDCANVYLKEGIVLYKVQNCLFYVDIPNYINNLQYESHLIKRDSWIKKIRADQTEKILELSSYSFENEINERKSLFYRGVDDNLRSSVWERCLNLLSDDGSYNKLLIQLNNLLPCQIAQHSSLNDGYIQIDKDLKRTDITTRAKKVWGENEKVIEVIERVLKCFVLYNSDLGYGQGMSDVVLGVMEYCNKEEQVFWIFSKVMDLIKDAYHDQQLFNCIIETILEQLDKELAGYFKLKNIGFSFMYRWIFVLFRREFIQNKAVRLWDAIFSFPENKLHYFIAVCLLIQHRDIILQNRLGLDDASLFFQNMANHFDESISVDADIAVAQFRTEASENAQLLVFCGKQNKSPLKRTSVD
ncbi:Rab-GAP TBC domain-containing protein [Entamoeba marina]